MGKEDDRFHCHSRDVICGCHVVMSYYWNNLADKSYAHARARACPFMCIYICVCVCLYVPMNASEIDARNILTLLSSFM